MTRPYAVFSTYCGAPFKGADPGRHKQPTILDGLPARIIFSSVKEGGLVTNEEKQTRIRPWIDPEERVTVHFLDAPDLNTTVTGCTDQSVDLSIETHVPHLNQKSQYRFARLR